MSESKSFTIGMMTSGGLAPCLSSSIAQLVKYWAKALKDGKVSSVKFVMYRDGYKGVLTSDSFVLPEEVWDECDAWNYMGGSPIGNSRVKVGLFLNAFFKKIRKRFDEIMTNQDDHLIISLTLFIQFSSPTSRTASPVVSSRKTRLHWKSPLND